MLKEHDRVVLTADLPAARLKDGDVGCVVHVYPDASGYEVEFVALDGTTLAVETVPAAMVREVRPLELAQARPQSAA